MEVEGQVKRIGSLFSVILGLQLVGASCLLLDSVVVGQVEVGEPCHNLLPEFLRPAEDCQRVNTEVARVLLEGRLELTSSPTASLQALNQRVIALSVVSQFCQRQAVLGGREVAVDASLSLLASVDEGGEGFLAGGECDGHMRGG